MGVFVVAVVLFCGGLVAVSTVQDGAEQCENILNNEMCSQLQGIAASRNVPFHQVELMMHASRSKGIRKPEQLYATILKYLSNFNDEVFHDAETSCGDVLPDKKCDELRKMTVDMKLETSDVLKGLKDSKFQGIEGADKIFAKVKEYFDSQVKCLKILDHERCGAMKLIALKQKFPFREAARKLNAENEKGGKSKQQLYQLVMDYLNSADDETLQASLVQKEKAVLVNDDTTACFKILTEKDCEELARLSQIFGVGSGVVDAAVVDAKLQGAQTTTDIMSKSQQFLEDRSYCEFIMEVEMCSDVQQSCARNGIPFHKVRVYMNDLYMNQGVKEAKKLFSMTKTFINSIPQLNDPTSECTGGSGKNKCMALLNSIMQCLSLKIFSWKKGLGANEVASSLNEACMAGGKDNLYKRTISVLKCRIYCKRGQVRESCAKIHTCDAKSIRENAPKKLVIGIDEGASRSWGPY